MDVDISILALAVTLFCSVITAVSAISMAASAHKVNDVMAELDKSTKEVARLRKLFMRRRL